MTRATCQTPDRDSASARRTRAEVRSIWLRIDLQVAAGDARAASNSPGGQFTFNLTAPNGEILLSSERYTTRTNAENGIASVKVNAPDDDRYDRRTAQNNQSYFVLKAANPLHARGSCGSPLERQHFDVEEVHRGNRTSVSDATRPAQKLNSPRAYPARGCSQPAEPEPEVDSAAAAAALEEARGMLARADKLEEQGKIKQALSLYETAAARSPTNSQVLSRLAFSYLNRGRNADAVTFASRASAVDPTNSEAWIVLVLRCGPNERAEAFSLQRRSHGRERRLAAFARRTTRGKSAKPAGFASMPTHVIKRAGPARAVKGHRRVSREYW